MTAVPPQGQAVTITSNNVTVRYGKILALNDFTVKVPSGIVGLLGPNGAGKSTFIKALLGLLRPDNGTMTIAGRDPSDDMGAVRDMIGYMPEHDCLIESLNAVNLVTYMGHISGMLKKDAIPRSHEVLDFVGIGEERYRDISSYSTGMKQRVKLAQAIVHDPAILFLDEPTNGMDPQGRVEMMELIKKISDSDKSIMVSTHILDDLEKASDYIIIINNGHLVTEGKIDELLAKKEGQKMIKAVGQPSELDVFLTSLKKAFEVRSAIVDGGQASIVLINKDDGNYIFKIGQESQVQIRAYYPERASLEDVFIGTLDIDNANEAEKTDAASPGNKIEGGEPGVN